MYVSQTFIPYTLNFYSTVCQLHLNRIGSRKKKTTTYPHAVMPCSLTICFAHATALAMLFSINSEMVRNENNIPRDFILSLGFHRLYFLKLRKVQLKLFLKSPCCECWGKLLHSILFYMKLKHFVFIYQSHWEFWNY